MRKFDIIAHVIPNKETGVCDCLDIKEWDNIDVTEFNKLTKPPAGECNCFIMSATARAVCPHLKTDFNRLDYLIYKQGINKWAMDYRPVSSLNQALEEASAEEGIHKIFVVGGISLFSEAANHPNLDKIILIPIESTYLNGSVKIH